MTNTQAPLVTPPLVELQPQEPTPPAERWHADADGKLHGYGMRVENSIYLAAIVAPTLQDLRGIWQRMSDAPFDHSRSYRVIVSREEAR